MPENAPSKSLAAVPPLQHISEFVREHGLQGDAASRLAAELGQPVAGVRGSASFYSDLARPSESRICNGTSCFLNGAEALRRNLATLGMPCRSATCLGYCYQSPVAVTQDGWPMDTGAQVLPDIRCAARTPIVTLRLLEGGAPSLARALELGAYSALTGSLTGTREAVLAAVERSGERGRGGAAFSTGRKWRACASADDTLRYVVANGDEGDSGSFLDRVLMEADPHAILEGLILCGFAVGAGEGIVFIRSEYPRAIAAMETAIAEASAAGFIGTNILGRGFDFRVSVFKGMGSYVCGEETALLNAIEGHRGDVRIRPPFPTLSGLHGHPTVVNNIETLANVPFIVADGGIAYSRLGTTASKGTKALCLNRGFARPGIVEVEFGITLREVIENLAGGAHGEERLAAVLLGGPMGSVVMPDEWDIPVCYEAMHSYGIELGHGGLVAVPEETEFRALLSHLIGFMIEESCGKCVPCRLGSLCAGKILREEKPGTAIRDQLEELFTMMETASLCAFGQSMPGPMRQLLDNFGHRIFRPRESPPP